MMYQRIKHHYPLYIDFKLISKTQTSNFPGSNASFNRNVCSASYFAILLYAYEGWRFGWVGSVEIMKTFIPIEQFKSRLYTGRLIFHCREINHARGLPTISNDRQPAQRLWCASCIINLISGALSARQTIMNLN